MVFLRKLGGLCYVLRSMRYAGEFPLLSSVRPMRSAARWWCLRPIRRCRAPPGRRRPRLRPWYPRLRLKRERCIRRHLIRSRCPIRSSRWSTSSLRSLFTTRRWWRPDGRKTSGWLLSSAFFSVCSAAINFTRAKPAWVCCTIFTAGLCGIGWLVDLIVLLTKPNPYYV